MRARGWTGHTSFKKKKKKKKIQLIFPRNIFEKDSIKAFATSRE